MAKLIKILFLAANPKDTSILRLDEEVRAIDQVLRQSKYRDRFEIKQHWAVRISDLQSLFLRHQPDIIHFSGHGSLSNEIILEDNYGTSKPVSKEALAYLFSSLKDNIRCVVLNACYSALQAQEIANHIDCVIGMSNEISDSAATSFSASFYQALGYGKDVKTAFELGLGQIELEGLNEKDIPQLLCPDASPSEVVLVAETAIKNGQKKSLYNLIKSKALKNLQSYKKKHIKFLFIALIAIVIGIFVAIAEFSGYRLKYLFSSSSSQCDTFTVLVHGERSINQRILPNRGKVIVNFTGAWESQKINDKTKAALKKIAKALKKYPETKVHLSGHTDSIGTSFYNAHLSQRIVERVMNFLIENENVSPDRFFMPIGYGEAKPIASNYTREGRFCNRRIEFEIFTSDAKFEIPEGNAITAIKAVDAKTIYIVCNGTVPIPSETMRLEKPYRFVVDFPGIYIFSDQREFRLESGSFIRALVAENSAENFARVVFDLERMIRPTITSFDNIIVVKDGY